MTGKFEITTSCKKMNEDILGLFVGPLLLHIVDWKSGDRLLRWNLAQQYPLE